MKLRSNRDTSLPCNLDWLNPRANGESSTHATITQRTNVKRKRKAALDLDNGVSSNKRKKTQVDEYNAPTTSGIVSSQHKTIKASGKNDIGKQQQQQQQQQQQKDSNADTIHSDKSTIVFHINTIPAHILISIFALLPILDRIRIERVCKFWRYLAKNYAWTKTSIFSYSCLIGDRICTLPCLIERPAIGNNEVKSLAVRCGKHIREMDLHAFRDTLTYNVCMSFASYCPNLTTLNMYGIQLTNSSVRLLGRHCPRLEIVNFHRCFQESVVERGLSSFFSKCCHLKELDVGENERLTGLPSFSMLPKSITTLKIGGCYRLTAESFNAIRDRCPNIVNLTMNGIDNITTTDLNNFFMHLGRLERLKFGEFFVSHTDGAPEVNFGALKNLSELTLNDNLLITNQALRTTVNNCRHLKYVDLSGCSRFLTNEGLVELARLPHLKHLNLSLIKFLSDNVVKQIAQRGLLEASFFFQTLLINCCEQITDDAILELLKCCPYLTAIDVSFCPEVTDRSMESMINYVNERQKKEEALPVSERMKTTSLGAVVTQMLRNERSLQALMDANFERNLIRFENFRYRFIQPEELRELRNTSSQHVEMGRQIIPEKCVPKKMDDSSDSEAESVPKNPIPSGPVNFRCSTFVFEEDNSATSSNDCFVLDTTATAIDGDAGRGNDEMTAVAIDPKNATEKAKKNNPRGSKKRRKQGQPAQKLLSDSTKELLARSIIKPGFEKVLGAGHVPMSWRETKRQRKIEKERTKGEDWFNLPANELTDERRRDLELLQMRSTVNKNARYRKNDHATLPKYFQVGTVVESKADFYSSRVPQKQRKQTLVEELLDDMEFVAKQKQKYREIKTLEWQAKQRMFKQHHARFKRRKA